MDADTPTWLTKAFLEEILGEGSEKTKVIVDSFEVRSAIPKGNNYVCDVLRVKVNYSAATGEGTDEGRQSVKSLIMKVPKSGGMGDFVMRMGIVQREVEVYDRLLPRLSEIYGANVFTAKSYKSSMENLLVLDDLNQLGYKMADRHKQLGYEECRVALKALARFHGASVKYHQEDPEYVESFNELLFNRDIHKEQPHFVTGFFDIAADEISEIPGCSKYREKIAGLKDKAWEILLDLFTPKKSNFNVLNHGDFWVTNMLFKYDEEGKPTDVKLLDLQIAKYNSPAVDLAYFFTGSVQAETRTTRFDDLLSEYLGELNATLEHVGVEKRLEMDRLKTEIKQFHFYELFVSFNLLPIVLCKPEEAFEIKEISEEDMKKFAEQDTFRKNFRTELYKKAIVKLMEEFEKKELF